MEALNYSNFDPRKIPFQERVLYHSFHFDYTTGPMLMLLSGTIGSAKSSVGAHMVVDHVREWPKARFVVGRQKMPDVKRTIRKEIVDHMKATFDEALNMASLNNGEGDYFFNKSDNTIYFANGSEIIFVSWHDADWEKFRSMNISGFLIEEGTENRKKHWPIFNALVMRLGRQPHVPVNIGIVLTNPDGPEHEIYLTFIDGADQYRGKKVLKKDNMFTFFSKSDENPFLPPWYIEKLRKKLPPKEAKRMLDGEWVSIMGEVVYYCFDVDLNYKNEEYKVNKQLPLAFTWDFNIGEGKPLSMCCRQYDPQRDHFDFFNEVIIAGARTGESVDELLETGILNEDVPYFLIHGDPAGKARDTRTKVTDYGIIRKKIANYERVDGKPLREFDSREEVEEFIAESIGVINIVPFVIELPSAHPPVRSRHNHMNAYLLNDLGERRMTIWKAPTLKRALQLTKLKKGSQYIEDDSDDYQHVGTAAGYSLCEELRQISLRYEDEDYENFNPVLE